MVKDVASRFGFTCGYSHLSSRSGRDFWSRFMTVASFDIMSVQRDYGSEFLEEFLKELEKAGLEHYIIIIVRNPRGNGYIERDNRALEEELIKYRELILRDNSEEFDREFMRYYGII